MALMRWSSKTGPKAVMTDMTAAYGEKKIAREHCTYLRPIVVHAESTRSSSGGEGIHVPVVSVVECPEAEMMRRIGPLW